MELDFSKDDNFLVNGNFSMERYFLVDHTDLNFLVDLLIRGSWIGNCELVCPCYLVKHGILIVPFWSVDGYNYCKQACLPFIYKSQGSIRKDCRHRWNGLHFLDIFINLSN